MNQEKRKTILNIFMPLCCAIATFICVFISYSELNIEMLVKQTAFIAIFEIMLGFFLNFGPQAELSGKVFPAQLIVLETVFAISVTLWHVPYLNLVFMLTIVMLTGLLRLDIGILTFAAGVLNLTLFNSTSPYLFKTILITFALCILIYALRSKSELLYSEFAIINIFAIYNVICYGLDSKVLFTVENLITLMAIIVILLVTGYLKLKYICFSWNLSKSMQNAEQFITSNEINEAKKRMYSPKDKAELDDNDIAGSSDLEKLLSEPEEAEEKTTDVKDITETIIAAEEASGAEDANPVLLNNIMQNQDLEAINTENSSLKNEILDLQEQINRLKLDTDNKNTELINRNLEINNLSTEHEVKIKEFEARYAESEAALREAADKNEELKSQYEVLSKKYNDISAQNQILADNCNDLTAQNQVLADNCNDLTAQNQVLSDNYKDMTAQNQQLTEMYKALENQDSGEADELRRMEEENSTLAAKVEKLEAKFRTTNSKYKDLQEINLEMDDTIKDLEDQIAERNTKVLKLEKDFQSLETKNTELEEICEDSLARIRELEEENDKLRKEKEPE